MLPRDPQPHNVQNLISSVLTVLLSDSIIML
jgi:hypothetical protein